MLFATGALNQNTINIHGRNKYVLSVLGEKLLCFGMGTPVKMERVVGTKVALDYASPEVCEAIVDEIT